MAIETVRARLVQVEKIRDRWKGVPGYRDTLEIDIAGLRLLLASLEATN